MDPGTETLNQFLFRVYSENLENIRRCQDMIRTIEQSNMSIIQLFSDMSIASRNIPISGQESVDIEERARPATRAPYNHSSRDSIRNVARRADHHLTQLRPIIEIFYQLLPNSPEEQPVPPSQQEIHEAIETHVFPTQPFSLGEDPICPISMEQIVDGDEVSIIRSCNHFFKKTNLLRWFERSSCCPICRRNIRQPPSAS